jgi:hypothetical protein
MGFSPQLVVAAATPALDYPRHDLPPHLRLAAT